MTVQIITLKRLISYIIIFVIIITNISAQTSDTLKLKTLVIKSIAPISLIGIGAIMTNSQFEQTLQADIRNKVGDDYECTIDDYTQYMPIAEMYLADLFQVTSKNHWFDQTKYLLISNFISAGVVHGLKTVIYKPRPDGSASNSFPSGHTTLAFTNATVLFNEFQQSSALLAYSGYAFAVTTGAFRVINNKHWLSDVLVGAGIGILATHIVYYIEPLKNFNPFSDSRNVMVIPKIDRYGYGVYFSYVF